MIISIAGCGWFGLGLAKALVHEGHEVKGSTTTTEKINTLTAEGVTPYLIDFSTEDLANTSFFTCDVLVIAIPPKVQINEGNDYLTALQHLLTHAKQRAVNKIILISSTSVYSDTNSIVDEDTLPAPDTLSGRVLLQAEQLFTTDRSIPTTIVRFSGLVGPGRDPGRFFAGKQNISNGLAPINLIHLDDCIGIVMKIMKQHFFGHTINAVSPHHPTRKEFYTHASAKSGLALPHFIDELITWKEVRSKYISDAIHYEFKIKDWFK